MKTKKILTALLTGALVAGTMTVAAMAQEETASVSVWDGTSYSLEWLSTGNPEATAGDKFYLNTADDLAGFAYYVNNYASTNNIFTGDTVYLNVDVDLDNHPWAPIGTAVPREKNRFYGSFDGQGHIISNLKVAEGHKFAGFFGQIPTYTYTQKFVNIKFENATVVAADDSGSKEAAGVLIGRANGSVVENCHVTGEVYISGDRFVGGLLGHSYARISDCSVTATGTINAVTWQAGGLVGSHGATASYTSSIENCAVDGGKNGLAVTSYYAAVGGAIGAVSVSGVESTPMDNITVKAVTVAAENDSNGTGVALVASGYTATNSIALNVATTLGGEAVKASDEEATKVVAVVGEDCYTDLVSALKAITAENNVVEILDDITITEAWDCRYTGAKFTVPVTIKGNGHTIAFTNTVYDAGNHMAAFRTEADATFIDLTIDMSEAKSGFAGRVRAISAKADLVVNNCIFIGNSELTNTRAIIYGETAGTAISEVDVEITGSKFINWTRGISDNENAQDAKSVIVTRNYFTNSAVYLSAFGTIVFSDNNTEQAAKARLMAVTPVSIRSYTNKLEVLKVTDNDDAEITLTDFIETTEATFDDDAMPILVYTSEEFVKENSELIPNGTIYVTQPNKELKEYLVNEGNVTTTATVELVFVPNTEMDRTVLPNTFWDIVLISDSEGIINRLNSADFTFALDAEDDMTYEILATNDEIVINNVNNDANRFEFHYEDKDEDVDTDTATRIILGTVKFTGYSKFNFSVVSDAETNEVHTTTLSDNIVDTFTADANNLIVNNEAENEDGDNDFGVIESEITTPTRDLVINIAFPNAVENKTIAYQNMSVKVTGEDIPETVINLGSDMEGEVNLDYNNKNGEKYTAKFENGGYVITFVNALTQNTAYNVEVSGEGYRTARYTVNMQETAPDAPTAKVLNFWNNVKDNAIAIEEGKNKMTTNFLAGDIVKDNTINIYDLSAVVSYFGEIDLATTEGAEKYAKYDLNRDGKIDSKDVAYVLVSWNN